MSDPVTNVEIEDVLSSIRRLVSEDSRPESMSEAPQAQRSASAGRLVLTPALRVQEGPASEETDCDTGEGAPARHAAPLAARLVPAEEEVAEVARPAPLRAIEPEAATVLVSEAAVSDEIEEAPFIEVDEESESEFAEASIADFFALKQRGSTPPQAAPIADATAKEGSLAQKIAELEEMIARSTHEFEPERGEAAPEAIFRHQPGDEPAPSQPVAAEEEDEELASRPMPEPELVDEPYALESPVQPDITPDGDAVQDEPEETVAAQQSLNSAHSAEEDGAAEELQPEPEPEPAPRRPVKILRNPVWQRSQSNLRSDTSASEQPPTPVAEAPIGVDEERLRALIADVVREELQGALGDRATRTIRTLVRRELQRLLASDDLD